MAMTGTAEREDGQHFRGPHSSDGGTEAEGGSSGPIVCNWNFSAMESEIAVPRVHCHPPLVEPRPFPRLVRVMGGTVEGRERGGEHGPQLLLAKDVVGLTPPLVAVRAS